jgi:NADPH:quinone reductase-like Zn-dependent oxidoreductase
MQSWALTGEPGHPLRLEDRPEPELGPGQVRVRLRAASLNYRDLIVAAQPPRPGLVPLSDGAGEVAEVAQDVRDLQAGDRVAAAFPCAAVTAWHALVSGPSPAGAGDTVLALGSGGVATFTLQIARLRGARFIGTSSSEAKREWLRAMGADVVIDYAATPQWSRDVRQATGGHGADFVVETGGAATLEQSLQASARGGCVTLIGVVSGRAATADARLIQGSELTLRSIYVGPLTMLRDAMQAFADHGVRPVIDRSFAFSEAPAAFGYLRDARHVGKVVIEQ